jgi:5'-nucleotidase
VAWATIAVVAASLATVSFASAQQQPTCWGRTATIVADGSGGEIRGTSGNDVIVGTLGADTIFTGDGDDIVCGLGGNDKVFAGRGKDTVIGGPGNDKIFGGPGKDLLRGGAGNDRLIGGSGNDKLIAGFGRDFARGGPGADLLTGGTGNDKLHAGPGPDRVVGGNGNDRLRGDGGRDIVSGGLGWRDRVNGGGGTDVCRDASPSTTFVLCENNFELTVLHINDHHSHLEANGSDLELPGGETEVVYGGFPAVVSKFDELAATNSDRNVVKVHAGDAITGTLYYSLFEGEADAALMNEVCFDLFALGNHEFDGGDQTLANFLDELGSSSSCDTTTIAANVVPAAGTPLAPNGEPVFERYEVINYGNDRVGYVGIDIAGKTQNSSSPLATTQFLDEVETAQSVVDELRADGVNKIVLVTHQGLTNDLDLASQVSGVDVIVGGDSHTLLGDFESVGLNTGGTYPIATSNADGKRVCVVQAWQYSNIVGELDVTFDAHGNVISCNGTPHLLLSDTFQRSPDGEADEVELQGAERQAVLDFIAATPELSVVTPDANTEAVLANFSGQVDALTQQVVGTNADDLCLERIPGQGRSEICDVADTAANGGDIQQLVTEAFLVRSFESDIALQNAGGVRIDIPAGEVTIADVYELLPFANTIVNLEMSGTEVAAVIEEALSFALDPDGSTGAYPYAANLRWDVDLTAADGNRVSNLEFFNGTSWGAFDTSRNYTVATNSFIAAGRDGYDTFGTVTESGRSTDTFLDYAQSFIDYIELDANGSIAKLPADRYSTQNIVTLPQG